MERASLQLNTGRAWPNEAARPSTILAKPQRSLQGAALSNHDYSGQQRLRSTCRRMTVYCQGQIRNVWLQSRSETHAMVGCVMNCQRPTLLVTANEVRQADVHHDVFFRRACLWNYWEIWQEALNHVQAPGRIQDRRDMRGLTLDKAYRRSQTLSLWFRRRMNDLPSFWKVSSTNSGPLDDLELLEFHISSCRGAVKLLKPEWREQTSAIASHLYEGAFANKITMSAHSW
jgi:hypothetical protein